MMPIFKGDPGPEECIRLHRCYGCVVEVELPLGRANMFSILITDLQWDLKL